MTLATIVNPKIFEAGNSYVITVPKHLINTGVVDPEERYHFKIIKSDEVEE